MRLLISGLLRQTRNAFVKAVLAQTNPTHVLEIGGGRGGDAANWVHHKDSELIDVVEPDGNAVEEYRRRLLQTFHGVPHKQNVVLPSGKRFRFHTVPVFDLPPSIAHRGCELAVMNFSISQIMNDDTHQVVLT